MLEFTFADVGEGITEGELVRWHVSEGDRVEENQTLVEIETDKAIVDIPSPCDGEIQALPHAVGDTIEVGEVLAVIDADDEEPDESTTVVGEISTDADVIDEPEDPESAAEDDVLATPKTRKLADDLGVNLRELNGTGKEGRITDEDVRAAARDDVGVEVESGEDEYGPTETVRLKGVRKRIAERTRTGHEEVPQVTHMDEADVTDLRGHVTSLREDNGDLSYKLTLTPFVVKALVDVLQDHPYLNSTFEDDSIILRKYYNIGVTVDTEDGLIVPVLRNADDMSLFEIGREIHRLADRARSRALDLNELQGGTFTLTNIGFLGGTWSTPQVNYPQAAILATGRADERPAVRSGELTIRSVLPLSLSFDHRILDGADAARFINDLTERLGNPDSFEPE